MLLERSSDISEDVGLTIFGRSKVVESIYQLAVREYLLSPLIALRKKKSIRLTKALKICDFHVPHDAICFPPKICISFVFKFCSRDDCYSQEKMENIVCTEFYGENKLHYGERKKLQIIAVMYVKIVKRVIIKTIYDMGITASG